jgi:hypothetical protein
LPLPFAAVFLSTAVLFDLASATTSVKTTADKFQEDMMDWLVILSIGLVGGTLLTLFFISRRPINVNLKVDARAEAHGGSAHASAPSSPLPVSSGSAAVGGDSVRGAVGVGGEFSTSHT